MALLASISALALSVAGCSTHGNTLSGSSAQTPDDPSRIGSSPWADVFATTYAEASTSEERRALEDGDISDAEYAYFQDKIVDCFAANGAQNLKWTRDRTLSYSRSESTSQEALDECDRKNGLRIIVLKDAIDRNPNQLDENEIMVSCLRRNNVVGREYTAEMYAAGINLEEFIDSSAFDECNARPLEGAEE